MDEKAIQDAYTLFVGAGYKKDINEFKSLMLSNDKALNDSYTLFLDNGYTKSIDDYKTLIGVSDVKKKEPTKTAATTELPSENGSLDSESNSNEYHYKNPLEDTDTSFQDRIDNPQKHEAIEGTPLENKNNFNPLPPLTRPTDSTSDATSRQQPMFNSTAPTQTTYTLPPISTSDQTRVEKPFIDNSPTRHTKEDFNKSLSKITPDLINKEEENVVPELNYQFKDHGFKFEETGVGDEMKVIAPNGKQTLISLDPLQHSDEVSQSKKLQDFLKANQRPVSKLDKVVANQDAYNKKFLDQKEINESLTKLGNQQNDFEVDIKQFTDLSKNSPDLILKANRAGELRKIGRINSDGSQSTVKFTSFEEDGKYKVIPTLFPKDPLRYSSNPNDWMELPFDKAVEVARQRGEVFEFKTDAEAKAFAEGSWKEISGKAKQLEARFSQLESDKKTLDQSIGKYTYMQSQQGTLSGGIWNSLLEGVGSVASGITGVVIDTMTPGGVALPDETKKMLKKAYLPSIREGLKKQIGDENTTDQWKDVGFVRGAVMGLAKSLPAMAGGVTAMPILMYSQVSDDVDKQMMDNPAFDNISENEKMLVKVPLGIVSAALETFGFRNVINQKGLLNGIAMKVIGEAGAGVTAKTFKELVDNEIKGQINKGILRIGAGGLAEFETGAAQEVADISIKQIYNAAKDKEMFDTPDSVGEYLGDVLIAGTQEAIGGLILGTPVAISSAFEKNDYKKVDNTTMEIFSSVANDPTVLDAMDTDLKMKVNSGELTPQEAETQNTNYREAVGVLNSIDTEGLEPEEVKEKMILGKEVKDLELKKNGKIPSDRKIIQAKIDALNEKLFTIGTTKSEQENLTKNTDEKTKNQTKTKQPSETQREADVLKPSPEPTVSKDAVGEGILSPPIKTENEITNKQEGQRTDIVGEQTSKVATNPNSVKSINKKTDTETKVEPAKSIEPIAEPSLKEAASQRLVEAKEAFRKKISEGLSSGGLHALPEFVDLVKAHIEVGVLTAKDFIKSFKKEYPDLEIDEAEASKLYDKLSTSGVTHAQTNATAKEFGLDEYEKETQTEKGWDLEADSLISKDKNAVQKIFSKLEKGGVPTGGEVKVMQRHISSLNSRLRSEMSDELLDEFKKAKNLYDIAGGHDIAIALRSRQGAIPVEDSLGDLLLAKKEAAGVDELTEKQKEDVKKMFDDLQDAKTNLEDKLAEANKKNNDLRSKIEFNKIVKEAKRRRRKVSKEKLDTEFEDLTKQFSQIASGTLSSGINPELVSLVGKMVSNRISKGVVNLADVIDAIYDKVSGHLTKDQINEIIAGKHNVPRRTRGELENIRNDLKTEAILIAKLEALQRQEIPKIESKKVERNQRIKDLRDQIKDSDVKKLADLKRRNELSTNQINEKISNKEYSTVEKAKSPLDNPEFKKAYPELYNQVLDSLIEKENAKAALELDKWRDLKSRRKLWEKVLDISKSTIALLRAFKSGFDDSALMVQLGFALLNPNNIKFFPKVFKEHLLDAFSKTRFNRSIARVHNSEWWSLMHQSGLDILDPASLRREQHEEVYTDNPLQKIKIKHKGKEYGINFLAPFERAFTSAGNNLRELMFLSKAKELMEEGKTFETHPKDFKDIATVVNNMTARTKLPAVVAQASPIISPVIWSPKMIASALNLLGVSDAVSVLGITKGYYRNMKGGEGGLKSEWNSARAYAIKQTVGGIAMGYAILISMSLAGADVDDDPDSVNFGSFQLYEGGDRYFVFGRFTSFVRLIAMSITGEKKTPRDVETLGSKFGGPTIGSEFLKFARGKVTPSFGTLIDAYTGKMYDGSPFSYEGAAKELITPMSVSDIMKGLENNGVSGLVRGGLSFFGTKISNEKDFEKTQSSTASNLDDKEYKEELKKYAPAVYEQLYGPSSPTYQVEQMEKEFEQQRKQLEKQYK